MLASHHASAEAKAGVFANLHDEDFLVAGGRLGQL